MIRIGLNSRDKQKVFEGYLNDNEITQVKCFYFKKFPLNLKTTVSIENIEYQDIEMYKFFYRLLEEIDDKTLLVFNECMRTQNRSELIYNCAHHYCNQTPHKLIFEHFPLIENKNDFMILLDLKNKGKYKGKPFDYPLLYQEDIKIKPHPIKMEVVPVETTDFDRQRYEKKKESLFNNLGEKDPDTIPRNLQLLAGDIKKKVIDPDTIYVARNKRFKLPNVVTYNDINKQGQYVVIDTHYRRLEFNDFLKTTNITKIKYLSTTLPIDSVIINGFAEWKARLDSIYAQASIYK